MIEKTVLDWLGAQLSVPVYAEVPEDPPAAFVTIEKTGAGLADRLSSATLAVQSYGASLYDAAALSALVRSAMARLDSLPRVSRCDFGGEYNWPDARTKRRRYQAVFTVYFRE